MGKISKALEKSQENFLDDLNSSDVTEEKKENKTSDQVSDESGISEKNYNDEKEDNFSYRGNVCENLITVNKPHSVESEQFRILKNTIMFPESGKRPKTIMVTSTDKGEGKSFVASNLAVTIAASIDNYVVLLDADLRDPSVHDIFGIKNSVGLSDYLDSQVDLPAVLKKTFLAKLTLIPAGPPPLNPSELLSSDHMKRLIKELETRYDDRFLIIDTPPPYVTSEANALATYVDGVIIVAKYGSTKKKRLKDIVDTYGKEKILGVVNNFSRGKFGVGYYYDNKYINNKKEK